MDYRSLLEKTAKENNSISCMGIDPNFSSLPEGVGVDAYYVTLLEEIKNKGIGIASFKPNIGYFSRLDKPLDGDFSGSKALAS